MNAAVYRYVLQHLDAEGFVVNGMIEAETIEELRLALRVARRADERVRVWDRLEQRDVTSTLETK